MRMAPLAGVPRFLRTALAAALALALVPTPSDGRTRSAGTSTAQRFRQAVTRFRNLTESPTARRRPELWDQAAARFRAIASASPSGAYADDASYLLGEVYHERFHTFHRDLDLDLAIETYEAVPTRYPGSSYADDALVQLGEIHYYQLGDARQALRFYRRAVEDYPYGDMTGRARIRIGAIEKRDVHPRATVDSPEATVGTRPLPGRPLSSPGAVVGGRLPVERVPVERVPMERLPVERLPEIEAPREATVPRAGEAEGEATASPPPALRETVTPPPGPEESGDGEAARAPMAEGSGVPGSMPSRPLNPLLEEGPIPLRTPADRLPILPTEGPRSQTGFSRDT